MINKIRNFAIIAHIDHGKSTLADRFLEITGTVPKEKLKPQHLDRLSLERERGITIKMQPVTMEYNGHLLNLIDTPGHVDFTYEVSRALAAVEGAILLVDGTQGIQAQTVANLEIAQSQNLEIIPAINKIDLEIPNLEELIEEIKELTGKEKIYLVSAKYGTGVEELLKGIIKEIRPPELKEEKTKALIFDSHFDPYKGIIAHVRVFSGKFKKDQIAFLRQKKFKFKILEVGIFKPELKEIDELGEGMIGFIATGIKDSGILTIGDTITLDLETEPLPGYQSPQPNIFASVYPSEEISFDVFKESLNKLRLNDPSLFVEPTSHPLFGRGFNVGCLGLLHLEIFEERLKREFNTEIIITMPSVKYLVKLKNGEIKEIKNPNELPSEDKILEIQEPKAHVEIFTPQNYLNSILEIIRENRGETLYVNTEKIFVRIKAKMPLDELISGFFDELKSVSSGYASLRWEFLGYEKSDLVKLDILIAEEVEPSLSRILPKSKAEKIARKILLSLKENLERQEFPIKLQAKISGRIIARETVPAIYRDIAGWLYGGDRTRKMKLWQKQKKGKKKLEKLFKGKVKVPNKVLIKILKIK
ncbi:MAG: translation elongation factor 4 [Candidatus Pacebacteria bacterium]|jgi:GTP-binding protein LepA|nr:translation elongation factor 4 [Candidatus Paceibacterota bacterium]